MPDQNSYADSVDALDALRRKATLRTKPVVTVDTSFDSEGTPSTSVNTDSSDVAAGEKQEAQLARLQMMAVKVRNELSQVHQDMKSNLTAEATPESDAKHDQLLSRATMLRNKLYYLQDVGKEISGSDNAFPEMRGDPTAAEKMR